MPVAAEIQSPDFIGLLDHRDHIRMRGVAFDEWLQPERSKAGGESRQLRIVKRLIGQGHHQKLVHRPMNFSNRLIIGRGQIDSGDFGAACASQLPHLDFSINHIGLLSGHTSLSRPFHLCRIIGSVGRERLRGGSSTQFGLKRLFARLDQAAGCHRTRLDPNPIDLPAVLKCTAVFIALADRQTP